MIKYLLILLLIAPPIHADCPEDVQAISKGEVANCDGLLFSEDAARKADASIQDAKYYKNLSELLTKRSELSNKEIDVLTNRLELYINQSEILAKEVYRKESEDKWQKLVYFGLGVIATGVAVYGASQLK